MEQKTGVRVSTVALPARPLTASVLVMTLRGARASPAALSLLAPVLATDLGFLFWRQLDADALGRPARGVHQPHTAFPFSRFVHHIEVHSWFRRSMLLPN